jgi:flagellar biosynthesis/type III secretory pathway chaperone
MTHEVQALPLLEQVSKSVATLRQTLEQHALPNLEAALIETETALQALNLFPGGVEGLRKAMDLLPSELRDRCHQLLEQAKQDHQINAELIRLAMQRNAALQAYTAQSSSAATYSSEGGVAMVNSGQLLGKY